MYIYLSMVGGVVDKKHYKTQLWYSCELVEIRLKFRNVFLTKIVFVILKISKKVLYLNIIVTKQRRFSACKLTCLHFTYSEYYI